MLFVIPGPDRGRLLCPRRLSGVELPVVLFDAAGALVPGNGSPDVVRPSPLARCGDLLLRLARRQNQDPIVEGRRRALAASGVCGRSAPAPAGSRWSMISSRPFLCADHKFESVFLQRRDAMGRAARM